MDSSEYVPGGDEPGRVAAQLLDIVGPGRVGEVLTTTAPAFGFRVPVDVAVEYRRRTTPAVPGPSPVARPAAKPAAAPVNDRSNFIPAPMRETEPRAQRARKGATSG